MSLSHRQRRIGLLLAVAAVWAVAIAARWTRLPEASALGDSLGPWLVGARGPWQTHPHAPPYGWLLAVPHAAILWGAQDLWSAFAAIRVIDAVVAPILTLAVARHSRSTARGLAAGLLMALDPGLLDTATSGAEAYQAPVAIALVVLATTAGRARWGPWLAAGASCWAWMCHPLALVVSPLLLRIRWRQAPGAVLAGSAVMASHLVYLLRAAGEASSDTPTLPLLALDAWVDQAGPLIVVFALAGLGLWRQRGMLLSIGLSLLLLVGAGTKLGYLRDHHLRLLSPAVAMGLAGVHPLASLPVLALTARWPDDPLDRPGGDRRPGSLGLLHKVSAELLAARDPSRPLVVDGVTDHGVLAVEPGGVMLDLWLRGVPASQLDVQSSGDVAVILSGRRRHPWLDSPADHGLQRIGGRDTWSVYLGRPTQLQAWSEADCADRAAADRPLPRVGGAWDGLAIFHPERGAASVDWWLCSRDSVPAAMQPAAQLK